MPDKEKDIIIISTESRFHEMLAWLLKESALTIDHSSYLQTGEYFETHDYFSAVIEITDEATIKYVQWIREKYPSVEVVCVGYHQDISIVVALMRAGVFDYHSEPIDDFTLFVSNIKNAIEHSRLRRKVDYFRKVIADRYQFNNIIGNSRKMKELYLLMNKVINNPVNVVIQGESGTGKELVARALHFNGLRKEKPFISINCAAIPRELMEAEFFGHVKGSFTGAHASRAGLFESAHTGTLFLDEIAEIPTDVQVKFLRVLQENEIRRIGDNQSIKVDVAIIAATNKRLDEEVAAKRFRDDLYYRLNVISLHIPPLRERTDDIPLLVRHLIDKHTQEQREIKIRHEAIERMTVYPWPGNIRELENAIEYAITVCDNNTITVQDLPPIVKAAAVDKKVKTLKQIELEHIRSVLRRVNWNKEVAAKMLNIGIATLYRKIKENNITE